jgi:LytS/YehU family sensor histidine kinase
MVESGEEEAVPFIIKLSNFYRYTLESRKLDLIHVREEMEILNAYLFLQKARFEDGLMFHNELPRPVMDTLLPPFTLQLLVENCIKHNVVSLDKPLHIRLYEENGKIVVENAIQRKSGEDDSLGVGLENIRMRYSHLSGAEVEIVNGPQLFQIKLPLIYEHHHR